MRHSWTKFLLAAMVVVSSVTVVSVEAEAARMGRGGSFGRQSSNIMRTPATQAPTAPAMRNNANNTNNAATSRATPNTAATQPRSGFSRFLGPIAGIAAGLGIAALLSSLGLGAAAAEFFSSLILIGLVVFGVMFIIRRLRANSSPRYAANGPQASAYAQDNTVQAKDFFQQRTTTTSPSVNEGINTLSSPSVAETVSQAIDSNWFIPSDFDKTAFLQEAKKQFMHIQALWDKGDVQQLHQYLTDDLLKELAPQISAQTGTTQTEIVLLNAELLGIEKIMDTDGEGHLASVRFSGMIREEANQPTMRFEEVWNLYKTAQTGWLLAGIQQIQ
ncbi:Tim44 domain-containing protein [Pelistega ratti]|uniref:Tim44 domain-containing protein n=1 Tax=Pelistega ratti TaxID=2652177 RepID=UPI0013583352|nr:TIM44-like domain-containing protein [Pelistega ratti]